MRLTSDQAALLQGSPKDWENKAKKTARYRQIGHASPTAGGGGTQAIARALLP